MQHEFEDTRAVLGKDFLECIDLVVALLDLVLRGEFAHATNQNILVVRAVENSDVAAARRGDVCAPQKVVRQFLLARPFERSHGDAKWSGLFEDMLDGSVLSSGVGALQND